MRRFWVIIVAPVLAGCAALDRLPDRNVRSIAIQDHRFEPEVTVVQADKPVVLTIEGVDNTTVILSSPALGIPPTQLQPHAHIRPGGRPIPADYNMMGKRFTVGPLKRGGYELICDCHGDHVTGRLLVR